jgi:peptidoglycan/LPS O-acetylase OafA/YrhL
MERRRDLDVMRGLAVLLVMAHHMGPVPDALPGPLRGVVTFITRNGWMGVDLFFVLSGFLVSGLLFQEFQKHGRIRFPRFFVRRGFKIYPGFYAFLAISIAVNFALGQRTSPLVVLCESAFLQNYGPGLWVHTWSLAVEEHFYVVLPVILITLIAVARRAPIRPIWRAVCGALAVSGLLLAARVFVSGGHPPFLNLVISGLTMVVLPLAWIAAFSPRRAEISDPFWFLPWLFAITAVLLTALRLATTVYFRHPPFNNKVNFFPTHLRLDALMFGALMSYLHRFHPEPLRRWLARWWVIAAAVALVLPMWFLPVDESLFAQSLGLTCLYVGLGTLMMWIILMKPRARIATRPAVAVLAFFGFHSYAIYLWHVPVGAWLPVIAARLGVPLGRGLQIGLYAVLSVALGLLATRLIERPMLRLRDRVVPSPVGPSGALNVAPSAARTAGGGERG